MRKMFWLYLLLFFMSIHCSEADTVLFHKLDFELPGNLFRAMIDTQGFLWIASDNGLIREGGSFSEIFRATLPGPYVTALAEDMGGYIWVGSPNGLWKYNPFTGDSETFLHEEDNPGSLGDNFVNDILMIDDVLWISHDRGVDRYDRKTNTFEHLLAPFDMEGVTLQYAMRIHDGGNDTLLISYMDPSAVVKMDIETGNASLLMFPDGEFYTSDTWVRDFHTRPDGTILAAAGYYGLWQYDRTSSIFYSPDIFSNTFKDEKVQTFHTDRDSGLWVGTDSGLYRYGSEYENLESYSVDSGPWSLQRANIRDIVEDSYGNLIFIEPLDVYWTGKQNTKGLTYPIDSFITNITNGPADTFWIGTLENGLLQINHDGRVIASFFEGTVIHSIESLEEEYLLSGSSGLYRWNGKSWDEFPLFYDGSPYNGKTGDIFTDSLGRIYLTTYNYPAEVNMNTGELTYPFSGKDEAVPWGDEFDGLNSGFQDSNGRYWIQSAGGVYLYGSDRNFINHFNKENSKLGGNIIMGVMESPSGEIWIASIDSFSVYRDDGFEVFNASSGLIFDSVSSAVMDNQGGIWYSTGNSVVYFEPDKGRSRIITNEDGVPWIKGGTFRGAKKLKDGRLAFPGDPGVFIINPEEVIWSKVSARTGFRYFESLAGEDYEKSKLFTDRITINWQVTSFGFNLFSQTRRFPVTFRYSWRLSGYQDEWIDIGERDYLGFSKIPDGKYTLQVRSTNSDGFWTDDSDDYESITLLVAVHPARSPAAISGYILLGLGLIAGIFFQYRTVQQKKLLRERLVSDQLRKVDRLKDEFLANTTHELRTPLNGIIGIAESLIEETGETVSSGAKKELSLIASSGRRLTYLINDILDFSRLKEGDIELQKNPVDLSRLVNTLLVLSKPLCSGKPVELINEVPADLPPVAGDVNRIQQILHNLVGNAVKFTKEGSIKVTARKLGGTSGSAGMMEITV
ncbi:MAG: hypothetical protein KAU17_11130, partial [Spirochaetales bacterium]|nr:hypothetical protein [Spirochaetales bacterium]